MSVSQDTPAQGYPSQSAGSRKPRKPRIKKEPNPEARMPLIEHIRELRNRIIKIMLLLLVGSVIAWFFLYLPVWKFIEAPYCKLPASTLEKAYAGVTSLKSNGGCTLFVSSLFDGFFLKLKLSIIIGVVVTSPLWMYQLWAFVAPGLRMKEKRYAYFFAGTAFPLFAIGGMVAYFAMTKGLRFLLDLLPPGSAPLITIDSYISYALAMLLIFGLAFELPLVMVLFNVMGLLTHKRFARWRRMIIFGVFAFAAVATPAPDFMSMLLLAVPCVLLVELAEVFAWANDRRRARLGPVYAGLTPEEVSAYGLDEDLTTVNSDEGDVD
jgi:sec-independent protein translocase protein TatC